MVSTHQDHIEGKREGQVTLLAMPLMKQIDEGLTLTKDGGTCLRRLSMFRKEVH